MLQNAAPQPVGQRDRVAVDQQADPAPAQAKIGEKLCFVKWRRGASQSESPLPAQISAIHCVRSFCVKIGESTKQDSIRRPAPALVPQCLRFRSMPMPVPRS